MKMASMIRKALKAAVLLVVLLAASGYFAVHRLRTGPEPRSETLILAGLEEPVAIHFDSMGVPHLFASSIDDLFLAQGYVHATYRLWQMEMFRRVLQGRLSEIFGKQTLDTDRFLRTIGMEQAAEAGVPSHESPMYGHLERYARGVNAAIEEWKGLLPPEFLLLRIRPEPWTPVLSQGIEKLMAWDLSDYQTGLELAAARRVLGDSALAPLMPGYPDWGVTIVEGWPEGDAPGGGPLAGALPPPTPRELVAPPPSPTTSCVSWSWAASSAPPTPGWWAGSGRARVSPSWPTTCTLR